ncbi:MAG: hypothetical protein KJ000_03770 [Pirellulaceae bacterium]|nr:hypothetical protein [Pirellulaceae bacterium]
MAFEYVNRKEDRYYLQSGKTRTGKIRYYFGRKVTGTPVEDVPEGYEVYEGPETGQVHLRKRQPTRSTPEERETLANGIRRYAGLACFLIDVSGDSLVVYLPMMDENATNRLFEDMGLGYLPFAARAATQSIAQTSQYSKTMRFQLVDAKKRLFSVERWCSRGSIDDWICLADSKPLAELGPRYLSKLGTDDFYELC